jgi:hypothetical protein
VKDIVLVYAEPEPHVCDLPETLVESIPARNGTVVMCEECGVKYYARPYRGEYTDSIYYNWKRVSWWNFSVKGRN